MAERIELHLHTTASEDVSVITPSQAIEAAVRSGHKAVAVTCRNSVQDFPELEDCKRKHGKDIKVIYGAEVYYLKEGTRYGMALLAKNSEGRKELYRILSSMQIQGGHKVVDWRVIADNRRDLLCGAMTWVTTELDDTPENEALYDYIAIVPSGHPQDREKQWRLYTQSRIPVVAVGNCHYIDEADSICRKVVQWVDTWDYDRESTHFRTTRQMLQDCSYLGDAAAYEVVVTNANWIADQIEQIDSDDNDYPQFTLQNAKEDLQRICREKLQALYGQNPPSSITERLEAELALTAEAGQCSVYMLLHRIRSGLHTNVRGTMGSTLISYLLQISDVNPLPAHYRCPACKHTEFVSDIASGYDLPGKACSVCGATMSGDGHNIPHETYTGLKPEIQRASVEINIAASAEEKAGQLLIDCIGQDRIARAGSVWTVSRQAAAYVQKYQDSCGEVFTKEQQAQIIEKLRWVKVEEWTMPGGFLLLPEGMTFEDITPTVQLGGAYRYTHLNGYDVDHVLQRVNLLPYTIYDRIAQLHRHTGTKPEDIDYSDPEIYKLFRNADTCGIPNFSVACAKEILRKLENVRFGDLIRVLGMTLGTDVWQNNGEALLAGHAFSELIGNRDDILLTLKKYGLDVQAAHRTMETVRKGRFCADNDQNRKTICTLLAAGVPRWYIDSMRKIGYLFPKAHAAHYAKTAATLAWFKTYYPEEFYHVTLQDLDTEAILRYSNEALQEKLEAFEDPAYYEDPDREAIALLLEARHWSMREYGQREILCGNAAAEPLTYT